MNSIIASSAFAEADERAFDRAVRRLPGFWTWDYVEAGGGDVHAVVSPPWSPAEEAFRVSHDEGVYWFQGALDRTVEGRHETIEEIARVMRAVVMGDPITPNATDAKPAREPRLTAKGRPDITPDPNALTEGDYKEIETILGDWEDEGECPVTNLPGGINEIFVRWDERFPAFNLWRENGRIVLVDKLTFGPHWRASGSFTSVRAALESVRCVLGGNYTCEDPEVQAVFDRSRSALSIGGAAIGRAEAA